MITSLLSLSQRALELMAVAAGAYAIFFVVAWLYGIVTSRRITLELTETPRGEHEDLVVIIHGLSRRTGTAESIRDAVESAFGNGVDIFSPRYRGGLFSGASPFDVSAEIEEALHELERKHSKIYKRIHLVGYSMGGLIARKVFVWACGETSDHPGYGHDVVTSDSDTKKFVRPWALKVERIVLLAGVTRGWSLAQRPDAMPRPGYWFLRAANAMVPPPRTLLRLFRSFERGAPFVFNLRVQWIHIARRWARFTHADETDDGTAAAVEASGKRGGECPFPIVVQCLGTADNLVHLEDHCDLAEGPGFFHLSIQGGDHASPFQFRDPRTGHKARELFEAALTESREELETRARGTQTFKVDSDVKHVIFAVHGIRDFGDWPVRFAEIAKERAGADAHTIAVESPSYGYFPMLAFLLLGRRQSRVRWLLDRYTEILARYPNVDYVSFVGHSNGTYLLASALETYSEFIVYRVAFAGSVVRRNFDWDSFFQNGRVASLMNIVASNDFVVACLPRVFEYPLLNSVNDVGSAGFTGFESSVTHRDEVRFVRGGHGAAVRYHLRQIADYVLVGEKPGNEQWVRAEAGAPGGTDGVAPSSLVGMPGRLANLGSRFSWFVWAIMVALVVVLPLVLVTGIPAIGLASLISAASTGLMFLLAWYAALLLLLSTV